MEYLNVLVKNKTKQQVILILTDDGNITPPKSPKDLEKRIPIPALSVREVMIPENLFAKVKERYKDKLMMRPI